MVIFLLCYICVCRFVAVLEAALLNCVKKGVGKKRVVVLPHGFVAWRKEDYVLTWYDAAYGVVDDGEGNEEDIQASVWPIQSYPVKFHEWFFPEAFFLIEPDSYSRRILHDQEFSTVLSAVCVAMNALKASGHDGVCRQPVYVPKHDARRDAYGGVRVSTDGLQRFECDSIHGGVGNGVEYVSEVENRVALLMSRVPQGYRCHVPVCWTRMTYQVYQDTVDENVHMEGNMRWDLDMPWGAWARLEDPIGGVDVDVLHLDGNTGSLGDAKRMRILAMASDHAPDSGRRSFLPLQVNDVSRKFLQCVSICRPDRRDEMMRGPLVRSAPGSFSAMMRDFLEWMKIAEKVDNMSRLASEEWWVDHAERYEMEVDLGDVEKLIDMTFDDADDGENVFERFTLYATVPDSLRGLAQLWKQFLKRVRYEYWEQDSKVPHIPGDHAASCSVLRALGSLNYSTSQVCLKDMDTDTDDGWVIETLDMTQLKNPNVCIRVPVTQSLPHSSMEGLGYEPDSVARKLVFENMLLSDMEAFKFVNTGCEFEDFIRWYSPKDWDNDAMQLSHRMSSDCVWTRAWEKAQPRPLSDQPKSLFDPKGRGEQILHQLETMRPQDLIGQMFVSLLSSACSFFADSYEGHIVRDQVEYLNKWSSEVLDVDSMGVSSNLADKASELAGLVNMLSCVEHNVSAAVSLDQRLEGIESTIRRRLVNGMIESALNNRQGYEVNKDEAKALIDCVNGRKHFSLDGPISTEHSVEITDTDSCSIQSGVKHRVFISCLPGELRIATAIYD